MQSKSIPSASVQCKKPTGKISNAKPFVPTPKINKKLHHLSSLLVVKNTFV
jgi:hypothetical protein